MKLEPFSLLVLVLCATLFFCGIGWAFRGQPALRRQSDAHEMFLLRDALSKQPEPFDFYAGQVACAFNETVKCEEEFKKVFAGQPKSSQAIQAHRTLAAVALREGRYRAGLREVDALLAIDPNDSDGRETRPLLEVLSHFPDQAALVNGGGKATVQMDGGKVPLLINGSKASYFFDTGANLSVLTESEAVRLRMNIQEIKSGEGSKDVNGNKVSYRIAVAESLVFGSIQLRNVAFLVAGNEQQPFVDMQPGQRGLIGLPILEAFGSITWTREGVFEADRSPAPANLPAANICFDDLDLIAQASFEQRALPFVLDTGAETSDLWPKFANVARDLIRKSGTRGFHNVTGMGGIQKFKIVSVPKVVLQLGGESVTLQPAHILKTQKRSARKWFYGILGIDLLGQAQRVTIDFRSMRLELSSLKTHR